MKKYILILLTLFCATGFAQQVDSGQYTSFQSGEWLRFRLHYGFFNASYATLSIKDTIYQGQPAFHAVGDGRTTGLASLFFKVEDVYQSVFSKQEIRPIYFRRNIDEGGYTKDISIAFDFEKDKALINNLKDQTSFELPIDNELQDLISATYHLRESFDPSTAKKGDEVALDMLFDDDGVYDFKLLYLGKQVLKTSFGKVRCLAFRPLVKSGRIFREKESLTLWVSDDHNKIPIRIQADLRFGSIKADLDAFKGLKNPFEIIAN